MCGPNGRTAPAGTSAGSFVSRDTARWYADTSPGIPEAVVSRAAVTASPQPPAVSPRAGTTCSAYTSAAASSARIRAPATWWMSKAATARGPACPMPSSTTPSLSGICVSSSSAYRVNTPAYGRTAAERRFSSSTSSSASRAVSSVGSAGVPERPAAARSTDTGEGSSCAQNGQRGCGNSGSAVTSSEAMSWTSSRPAVSAGRVPEVARNTSYPSRLPIIAASGRPGTGPAAGGCPAAPARSTARPRPRPARRAQPQRGTGPAADGAVRHQGAHDGVAAVRPGGQQRAALGYPGAQQREQPGRGVGPAGHHHEVVAGQFLPPRREGGQRADLHRTAVRDRLRGLGLHLGHRRPRRQSHGRAAVAHQGDRAPAGDGVLAEDGHPGAAEAQEAGLGVVGVVVGVGDLRRVPPCDVGLGDRGRGSGLRLGHGTGEVPVVQGSDEFADHRALGCAQPLTELGHGVLAGQVRDDQRREAVGRAGGEAEPAVGVVEQHAVRRLGEEHVPADPGPGGGDVVEAGLGHGTPLLAVWWGRRREVGNAGAGGAGGEGGAAGCGGCAAGAHRRGRAGPGGAGRGRVGVRDGARAGRAVRAGRTVWA